MKSKLDIYEILFGQYGPLIGGVDLVKVLGFRTSSAFNKSLREHRIGVDIFDIPGRKGKFAYSEDVATWIRQVGNKSN